MTEAQRKALVDEYAMMARHNHLDLGPYESHEAYAEEWLRLGREMDLRLQLRKLWGKD